MLESESKLLKVCNNQYLCEKSMYISVNKNIVVGAMNQTCVVWVE